jgi:Gene product 88
MFPTKAAAAEFVGGLSKPSKMPGMSFGLSATRCQTGGILRQVEGSTCHRCYALKGAYTWKSTVNAHNRRHARLAEALLNTVTRDTWIAAMVRLLKGETHFRWHDSGDLQSVEHLQMIAEVADQTPWVNHWLPTREFGMVREFLRLRSRPRNLVIRMSAQQMDAEPPKGFEHTSTVHKNGAAHGYDCPSRFQDNECGPCRACWDNSVENVSYYAH